VLEGAKVDHLYAADTRRAQQTAAPVANQFGLPINLLASSDWEDLAPRIRREHRGETVVVVGSASTVPGIVSALTGQPVHMADSDYESIFLVLLPSPGDPRVLRLRYGTTLAKPSEPAPAKRP
jgi:broad specificity phosphatase PhoE